MPVQPVPAGYHTLSPYLPVREARKLIEFLQKAFEAQIVRISEHGGLVMNAEIRIGDSMLMVADTREADKARPTMIYMYVANADVTYERAVAAGAKSLMPPADMFYGDRHGGVEDPAGNQWWIATRIEDVSPDEVVRRAAAHQSVGT